MDDEVSGTAPAHAGGQAVLDLADGLDRMMGDRAMFGRVLERFRKDYRGGATAIDAALAADDRPLAQRLAHTLKGASGMIGAVRLQAVALDLEQALRGPAGEAAHLARLHAELGAVMEELDRLAAPAPARDAGGRGGPASPATGLARRLRASLDTGDGAALDLLEQARPELASLLGEQGLDELEESVRSFDYEGALALLERRQG